MLELFRNIIFVVILRYSSNMLLHIGLLTDFLVWSFSINVITFNALFNFVHLTKVWVVILMVNLSVFNLLSLTAAFTVVFIVVFLIWFPKMWWSLVSVRFIIHSTHTIWILLMVIIHILHHTIVLSSIIIMRITVLLFLKGIIHWLGVELSMHVHVLIPIWWWLTIVLIRRLSTMLVRRKLVITWSTLIYKGWWWMVII